VKRSAEEIKRQRDISSRLVFIVALFVLLLLFVIAHELLSKQKSFIVIKAFNFFSAVFAILQQQFFSSKRLNNSMPDLDRLLA